LIAKVASPWLIEVDGEVLYKDDLMYLVSKGSGGIAITGRTHVGGVGGGEADVSHNGDHHMLFRVEFSRVEAPGISEGGKLMSRKNLLHKFTCRESAVYNYPSAAIHWELGG